MLANRVRIGSRKKYIDEVYLAQDNDFSGTTNGSFGYMGTELKVKIPHVHNVSLRINLPTIAFPTID